MDPFSDAESGDDGPAAKNYRYRPFIEFETDRDFHERFRLTRRQADLLLNILGPRLQGQDTSKNFTPQQKMLMALRYYASNHFYYSVGDAQGPSKATICRAVKAVTYAIVDALNGTIGWPAKEQRCREIARDFARKATPGMPNVCGAIDGTLVKITPPTDAENSYVDRHHDHSINVLAVSDAKGRFLFLSARWPGSVNDARILRNSALKARFDGGYRPFPNAVLLGDSAFSAADWLVPMKNYYDIDDRNVRAF